MAANDNIWVNSTSATAYYPVITSGSSTVQLWPGGGGGAGYVSGGYVAPPVAPWEPTPLEWLDAEVERTCALART